MDALSGLGDSSSDSEHSTGGNDQKGGPVSSLFAGYSDQDDSSDNESLHVRESDDNHSGPSAASEGCQPSRKRRRAGFDTAVEAKVSPSELEYSESLPPPQLLSRDSKERINDQEGLYLCSKDYLKEHIAKAKTNARRDKKTVDPKMKEKLNQMYHNLKGKVNGTSTSFARKLKSQTDFGNPHLFPSVVEHFGIEPMGSCIPPHLWNPKVTQSITDDGDFAPFEFIDRLVIKEEENRLRIKERHLS